MHAGAFHQFYVDAVVGSGSPAHIGQSLQKLVGDYGQRRAFAQPGGVVDGGFVHRLLHEHAVAFGEPVAHFKSFLAVVPSLVCVHAYRNVGMPAKGFDYFLVVVESHFHFHDLVRRCFLDFALHFRRIGIVAYCE